MSLNAPTEDVDHETSAAETHRVFNQAPPLVGHDPWDLDVALREAVAREGGAWAEDELSEFARRTASEDVLRWGDEANRFEPELRTHDRFGHRIDEVEFHPSWHRLMELGKGGEVHSLAWSRRRAGSHVVRAAKHYLLAQAEAGVLCPLTMTFAAVPALRAEPDVAKTWIPRLLTPGYDARLVTPAEKSGCTLGMAMTEKQGGSDVRANTTRALPIDGSADEFRLTGHKWFCSAPMSDGFLTLAYPADRHNGDNTEEKPNAGLTCFLVPRILDDGTRNVFRIQRLKRKLGNRSNASSEVEYRGTWARRVGPMGRGIPTILEMVNHTRLDCVLGSAGLMRQALAQAIHHARHRHAFGRRLAEQPLMRQVLADLALEVEAATALAFRLARAFDAEHSPNASSHQVDAGHEAAFRRVATAIGKYWVCKRGPSMVFEAMECLGGNGYVEESILPRLYREMPVNSIWEGSGNVMCLDVLRALQREPDCGEVLIAELESARGSDSTYDRELDQLRDELVSPSAEGARRLVEGLAVQLQASQLLRHAPSFVAEAFVSSRMNGGGRLFGASGARLDAPSILTRAHPAA